MRYALCVSSGTAGLLSLALALNLRRKRFIAPPLTYGGSLASWLMLENFPIFADIDPVTLTLDPSSVRRRITKDTAAILAVDLFGVPTDSESLRKTADEFGVPYIADAAQSLGARRSGKPASVDADAIVVSFTAGKPVCAGEGGAVLTNNSDLYEKLVWHSQHPVRQRRDVRLTLSNEFAFNARIHPYAAEVANSTFESRLRKIEDRRKRAFSLADVLNASGLTQQIDFAQRAIDPTFFRFSAAWKSQPMENALITFLGKQGHVMSAEHLPYSLVYRQTAFRAQFSHLLRGSVRCPVAADQMKRRFCLRHANSL